jgi:hypothetical protein
MRELLIWGECPEMVTVGQTQEKTNMNYVLFAISVWQAHLYESRVPEGSSFRGIDVGIGGVAGVFVENSANNVLF